MNLTLDLKKTDYKTLFTTRKYIFFAGAMVVIAVGILVFGVFAQASSLVELFNANTTEAASAKALQSKVNALQQVSYLDEFAKSDKVSLALPSEKPLLQLISGVNSVAQQSGVSLSDIQTAPGKLATQSATVTTNANAPTVVDTTSTIPGVNILTIGLKAHGTLVQINTFLDSIEKITPITQATKLKLSVLPVVPGSAISFGAPEIYEAELELSTYYYSQAISVTVDSPLPSIGAKEETFLQTLDSYQFLDYQKQQQVQGGGSTDLFGSTTDQTVAPSPSPTPSPSTDQTPQ